MSKRANGEGTLRRRKDGTYEGRVVLGYDPKSGKTIKKSVYGKTKAIVKAKMEEVRAAGIDDKSEREESVSGIAGRSNQKTGDTLLKEWMVYWLDTYNPNIKPSTYSEYEQEIRLRINPFLGDVRLRDLTVDAIQATLNDQHNSGKASAKTISNAYGVIHKALAKAVTCQLISSNPSDGVVKPRQENRDHLKDCIMEEHQLKAFLGAMEECYYGDFFLFLLYTGIRKGEGFGLTWRNVQLQENEIYICQQLIYDKTNHRYIVQETKNSKPRKIALNAHARAILLKQKERNPSCGPDDYVFTSSMGTHLCPTTVHKSYKRTLKRIGLDHLRIHDLRHNFATISLQAGVDIKTLQDTLGHATEAFTLRQYSHSNMEMHHAAAQKTDSYFDIITSQSGNTTLRKEDNDSDNHRANQSRD